MYLVRNTAHLEIFMAIGSKWAGKPIEKCDLCENTLMQVFVDGRTANGQWAIMCPTCRIEEGCMNLGPGLGQKYERTQATAWEWVRTA